MWQKVQAKALFIEQGRRNEVTDLEIEDLSGGDVGAAAAETKALATGDPRYLRQVQLKDDVKHLTALEHAHHESARRRDFTVSTLERTIPAKERDLDTRDPVAATAAEHAASAPARCSSSTITLTRSAQRPLNRSPPRASRHSSPERTAAHHDSLRWAYPSTGSRCWPRATK